MARTKYLIALGSNQRHHRFGRPTEVLKAAVDHLNGNDLSILSVSGTVQSRPLGPSSRTYANAVAIIESERDPVALLSHLKKVEAYFGKRRGQRWSSRVLDLDIILSSHGTFYSASPNLCIPHSAMRQRPFVLDPAAKIAPDWRDPVTGLTIQQLLCRLKRAKPLDPKQKHH